MIERHGLALWWLACAVALAIGFAARDMPTVGTPQLAAPVVCRR